MKTTSSSKAKRNSPNETRGTETNPEMEATVACPSCGMSPEEWKGNKGRGVRKDEMVYCCEGCAAESGCTCE